MRSFTYLSCLIVALISLPSGIRAEMYHVSPSGDDANPGTQALPWRTIAQANTTLQAGDTVLLHAGVYEDAIWPENEGLSDAQRIIYRPWDSSPTGSSRGTPQPGPRVSSLGCRQIWPPAREAIPRLGIG